MVVADRRNLASTRTHRPERHALSALPSVAELLTEPAFLEGVPEVIVGGAALEAPVRWVHTSERDDIAVHLDGRELLLSMGTAWPDTDAELDSFITSLVDAGLSALLLELGTRYLEVPTAVRAAAQRHGLALVVLHRVVRFVTLTEAGHSRIIAGQMAALRARDEVRELFTGLALRGSPADHVVRELARTLGAPVVLESLAHEMLIAEVPAGAEAAALHDWERRSRGAHRGNALEEGWVVVPVDARGKRWGSLVALPGPAHPAGRRNVLLQGAIALALGRLADGGVDTWSTLARRHLLEPLMAGRFQSPEAAAARLEAAGVPVAGRLLYGLVLSGAGRTPADVEAWALALGARARALAITSRTGAPLTMVLLSNPQHRPLDDDHLRTLLRAAPDGGRVCATIGTAATDIEGALLSLHEALDNAPDTAAEQQVHWVERRPLARLISSLRDDHRLLDHGERMLTPLIEHDQRTGGDLLQVLGAALAHPGNRTAAAKAAHLSRSVFYQRLDLISRLLEVDLEDGETQTALHIALLSRHRA
ncbi:PucR family transcriptional regulator ligand-binding domain-containing protein [Demequina sp. SYSU T00039]|uniref:PucR family transcriptional regulator ligand-binding domain-containing protein n=1 Tax=Demequina lignilytica TaxID=3051663 RepID=A0AAW7M2G4_9MICO|nr:MULTISPECIES: PucR family transcriptional regulator [unclassified Demequina]MDN4478919.1 PucR family transcriptional regulator ligand-binding domain-containing protein [Demequina sp. SYSU T00039-1]MDN4488794.1 PucR family transcriptional regulator ligand-binding domain-containing protein [Demequina sp. SYSU T00039]